MQQDRVMGSQEEAAPLEDLRAYASALAVLKPRGLPSAPRARRGIRSWPKVMTPACRPPNVGRTGDLSQLLEAAELHHGIRAQRCIDHAKCRAGGSTLVPFTEVALFVPFTMPTAPGRPPGEYRHGLHQANAAVRRADSRSGQEGTQGVPPQPIAPVGHRPSLGSETPGSGSRREAVATLAYLSTSTTSGWSSAERRNRRPGSSPGLLTAHPTPQASEYYWSGACGVVNRVWRV